MAELETPLTDFKYTHPLLHDERDEAGVISLDAIIDTVNHTRKQRGLANRIHPTNNEGAIRRAEKIARHYHEGQTRNYEYDPETNKPYPYLKHVSETASILAKLGYSYEIVAAGYLHDILEMNSNSFELLKEISQAIKQSFSPKVRKIVMSLSDVDDDMLPNEEYPVSDDFFRFGREIPNDRVPVPQLEKQAQKNWFNQKFIYGVLKHPETLAVKSADRLANMMSFESYSLEQKQRIFEETADIYVPLLNIFDTELSRHMHEKMMELSQDSSVVKIFNLTGEDYEAAVEMLMLYAIARKDRGVHGMYDTLQQLIPFDIRSEQLKQSMLPLLIEAGFDINDPSDFERQLCFLKTMEAPNFTADINKKYPEYSNLKFFEELMTQFHLLLNKNTSYLPLTKYFGLDFESAHNPSPFFDNPSEEALADLKARYLASSDYRTQIGDIVNQKLVIAEKDANIDQVIRYFAENVGLGKPILVQSRPYALEELPITAAEEFGASSADLDTLLQNPGGIRVVFATPNMVSELIESRHFFKEQKIKKSEQAEWDEKNTVADDLVKIASAAPDRPYTVIDIVIPNSTKFSSVTYKPDYIVFEMRPGPDIVMGGLQKRLAFAEEALGFEPGSIFQFDDSGLRAICQLTENSIGLALIAMSTAIHQVDFDELSEEDLPIILNRERIDGMGLTYDIIAEHYDGPNRESPIILEKK